MRDAHVRKRRKGSLLFVLEKRLLNRLLHVSRKLLIFLVWNLSREKKTETQEMRNEGESPLHSLWLSLFFKKKIYCTKILSKIKVDAPYLHEYFVLCTLRTWFGLEYGAKSLPTFFSIFRSKTLLFHIFSILSQNLPFKNIKWSIPMGFKTWEMFIAKQKCCSRWWQNRDSEVCERRLV